MVILSWRLTVIGYNLHVGHHGFQIRWTVWWESLLGTGKQLPCPTVHTSRWLDTSFDYDDDDDTDDGGDDDDDDDDDDGDGDGDGKVF